uniref:Uncharacterized protein n=1 Tax=Tanacetum cinerariifolium TaxID=118510 RepID=A0A6L2L7E1_TANCI|nr:hypothetical protein [Tanacetum cinerariifolium]
MFESILLVLINLLMKKLNDFEEEYQVKGMIVGIKSLLDAVGIIATHVCVNAAQLDDNNDKNLSKIQLDHERVDRLVAVVVKVVHECRMMVKEIKDGLVEEIDILEDIDDEEKEVEEDEDGDGGPISIRGPPENVLRLPKIWGPPSARDFGLIYDKKFTKRSDVLVCISRIKNAQSTSVEVFKLSRHEMKHGLESRLEEREADL